MLGAAVYTQCLGEGFEFLVGSQVSQFRFSVIFFS